MPKNVNHFGSLLAVSYCSAIGALIFNTQPALVGALAETFGFSEGQLGNIMSITLIAVFCLVVTSFYWVHRVAWRTTMSTGALVACLGVVSLAFADGFTSVTSSLASIGTGAAAVYVASLACLATAKDPARAFGVAITTQVGLASVTVYLILAYLLPQFGFVGVVGLLFLLNLLVFGLLPLIPENRERAVSGEVRAYSDRNLLKWVLVGLGAMMIYFVGLNGTWAFLERIGVNMSLSNEVVGQALAAALLFGAIGSLIASVAGERIKVPAALWLSSGGFLIFVYLMLQDPGLVTFAVALIIFLAAWNFSLPYQMALISRADPHNRYIVLVPGAQTIGGAIGPAIAGPLLMSGGGNGVYVQLAVCIGAAMILYGLMATRLRVAVE